MCALCELFTRYEGEPAIIHTRGGHEIRCIILCADGEAVRGLDRRGYAVLVKMNHIVSVVEPRGAAAFTFMRQSAV